MISTCQSHLLARKGAAAALATESGSVMRSGSVLIAITPQLGAAREAPLLSSRIALSPSGEFSGRGDRSLSLVRLGGMRP